MSHLDEKVIGFSGLKIMAAIAGSCLFVAIGIWMLSMSPAEISAGRRMNSPPYVYTLGAVCVVFFGCCGVFALKKLFDPKPGLVLNAEGILDNSSAIAAGFIPWAEIEGFSIIEIQRTKMLLVQVTDPKKYVRRGGALKRMLGQMNLRWYGSPIAISSTALQLGFKELEEICNSYYLKYGRQPGN